MIDRVVRVILPAVAAAFFGAPAMAADAASLPDASGVKGGLVVHLGCGDGRLLESIAPREGFLVQGLDARPDNVEAARQRLRAAGRYGKVSVAQFAGSRLPYVDNLVNLLVAEEPGAVTPEEILRVLAPGGVAYIRSGSDWQKQEKPWPASIDQWTHSLHDATNNAVAQDTEVGPPAHYQWIGTPEYLRHHDRMSGLSALVSASGRLFYVMDLGPRWSVQMPPQWTLVARDAFNGVVLWQRPIGAWHPHLWPLKRGPAQIMRRLVAQGGEVYATLGVGAPVTALDAASGRTLREYAQTEGAEEILAADGQLYVLVNAQLDAYKSIARESVESISAAGRDWNWDEGPRRVVALEAASGRVRWTRDGVVVPGTMAAAGGRVYFHDGEKVVALGPDGRTAWTSAPIARWKPMHVLFNPTLVVQQGVVLFAGGEKFDPQRGGNDTMTALDAATGEVLWTAPHPASGYASAEDLFVIDGLVWCGVTSSPRDSGVFTGRDIRTGEVKAEFPPDDWRHMPHHRCHRAKATCKYILTSRTGIEFVDLEAKHWTSDHWVRGSCNYGIMPCNGLVYAPPHSCACYLLAKLNGFNALAAASPSRKLPATIPDADRLTAGPAHAPIPNSESRIPTSTDWPTYRHDAGRSGSTSAAVRAAVKQVWATPIGGRLSPVTVAGGRLFVAAIDAHAVHALDAESGKPLWTFTAGARVDSPPTVWQDRVLFGSADGHVYCLRAADGAVAWRFRAAPLDRRLAAAEQLESVWPVHGSVLVREGVVYCVAGRAMWLDGGLRLLRLDAATGRKLSETVLNDKIPDSGENLGQDCKWPNLPVALPDILSSDDHFIYMRSQPFDFEGRRTEIITPRDYTEQRGATAHLFSPTGFLDGSFWHRTYWMWGRSFVSGAGGWYLAGYQAPAGNILVTTADKVFGFGYAPLKFSGTPKFYHVFACPKEPKILTDPKVQPRKQGTPIFGRVVPSRLQYDWSLSAPLVAKGLVLAGDTLFMAGPPVLVDEAEAYLAWGDPAVQEKMAEYVEAFDGRKGALLMAIAPADGRQLAAYRLDSPPVFDGLAAASGRLYLAAMDGRVVCLGPGGRTPLEEAADAKLGPVSTGGGPGESSLTVSHPDFQQVTSVRITPSDLGYRMQSARGEAALAMKKLAAPITRSATFTANVRPSPGAGTPDRPGNGFIAFGDGPTDEETVKCGFRVSGHSLSIVQGPLAKGRAASKTAGVNSDEVAELRVSVNLENQTVSVTMHGQTLEAPLRHRLEAITWVGYCLTSVTTDFSPLEIRP